MMAPMKARWTLPFFVVASVAACGGKIDPGGAAPASGPQVSPSSPEVPSARTPDAAPSSSGNSTTPGVPPEKVESKATRDGKELYLSTCVTTTPDGRPFVWGEVTDLAFEVDEAILSLTFALPLQRGKLTCVRELSSSSSPGRVVAGFAESRGAEYVADPEACAFELDDDGSASGVLRGKGSAEYTDAAGERHTFTLDFAAPACKR